MKLNLKLQNSILTHKLDFVLVRIILNKKLSKQDKTLTIIPDIQNKINEINYPRKFRV